MATASFEPQSNRLLNSFKVDGPMGTEPLVVITESKVKKLAKDGQRRWDVVQIKVSGPELLQILKRYFPELC